MTDYTKAEARDWGREALRGVCSVIVPSFTSDFSGMNEAAIRHDVELNIKNGFMGALMVSEVAISMAEYERFFAIANDQARGRHMLVYHASFSTLEDNIRGAAIAAANGSQLALLTYPASFYAESEDDIFEYTKRFCDRTSLGVMLFPLPTWGFGRVNHGDMPVHLLRRLIDACPNIVAIKAEAGYPQIMGLVECIRHFQDEVVVSSPIESDLIPVAQLTPIQFSATSNTEYYGNFMPKVFDMLQRGDFDAATDAYWQINPGRKANYAAAAMWATTGLISRLQWKYQAWLSGYSGGCLRQPTMRVNDDLMRMLRQGLVKSGLPVTDLHDREFLRGRFPTS
jgi:4-hydroxy-tetrahydrodipicolinate synthase